MVVVLGAALIAVATVHAYTAKSRSWGPFVLGLISAGIVAYFAFNKTERTFSHVLHGEQIGKAFVLPVAIGVYVAGAGAILAVIAGWSVARGAPRVETTRKCPDCAETIQADARVCKHCGLRFGVPRPSA